jgi:uncharacterized repeat protein (TIGR01451 family)
MEGAVVLARMIRVFVAGVASVVLFAQPSTAWAQAGANLTIAMSHTGNFTVGENGVYTIVVSNIGGAASRGTIDVFETLDDVPNATTLGFVSEIGAGWSCSQFYGFPNPRIELGCSTSSVIAPGGSAASISLTVIPDGSPGTVTNTVDVSGGGSPDNSASDPTIVLAAVPTLPQWAMIALPVVLAFAGFMAMRRRTT